MNIFLRKVLFFVSGFIVLFFVAFAYSYYLVDKKGYFDLPDSVHTVILGDSHTQLALNDSLMTGCKNMSQSAEPYLYTYVKLQQLIKKKSQIKIIILGYYYHNISSEIDDRWLYDTQFFTSRVPDFLFFWELSEIKEVIKSINVFNIYLYKKIVKNNVNIILKKKKIFLGGYYYTDKEELSKRHKRIIENGKNKTKFKESKCQLKYLKKIYELCIRDSISLILLSTPVHEPIEDQFSERQKLRYYQIKDSLLERAILLEFNHYRLPDSCFYDHGHLNYKGAKIFSEKINDTLKNMYYGN